LVRANDLNVDGRRSQKFRIWATMSAGGNKLSRQTARISINLSNKVVRQGMPFVQGDKDIAVRGADGAGVVVQY
jgi:hypothetical protein